MKTSLIFLFKVFSLVKKKFLATLKVQSAISLINSLGYSGILLGPVIIGYVSKLSSLERSFELLGIAVFVVALVSFKILKQAKRS